MDIYDFQWSGKVIIKVVSKHNVLPEEVEQVFRNKHFVKRQKNVLLAYGKSISGRYLFVVFQRKGANQLKLITARDMTKKERKLYRRRI